MTLFKNPSKLSLGEKRKRLGAGERNEKRAGFLVPCPTEVDTSRSSRSQLQPQTPTDQTVYLSTNSLSILTGSRQPELP